MITWIIDTYSNSDLVKFFFWGPVVFNGIFYPIHVWKRVQKDRKTVEQWQIDFAKAEKYNTSTYRPSLHDSDFVTVGTLFEYFFLTFLPVLNALATIFHAAPIAWDYICIRFHWLFELKLVNK
jgi:hypothetical protein